MMCMHGAVQVVIIPITMANMEEAVVNSMHDKAHDIAKELSGKGPFLSMFTLKPLSSVALCLPATPSKCSISIFCLYHLSVMYVFQAERI